MIYGIGAAAENYMQREEAKRGQNLNIALMLDKMKRDSQQQEFENRMKEDAARRQQAELEWQQGEPKRQWDMFLKKALYEQNKPARQVPWEEMMKGAREQGETFGGVGAQNYAASMIAGNRVFPNQIPAEPDASSQFVGPPTPQSIVQRYIPEKTTEEIRNLSSKVSPTSILSNLRQLYHQSLSYRTSPEQYRYMKMNADQLRAQLPPDMQTLYMMTDEQPTGNILPVIYSEHSRLLERVQQAIDDGDPMAAYYENDLNLFEQQYPEVFKRGGGQGGDVIPETKPDKTKTGGGVTVPPGGKKPFIPKLPGLPGLNPPGGTQSGKQQQKDKEFQRGETEHRYKVADRPRDVAKDRAELVAKFIEQLKNGANKGSVLAQAQNSGLTQNELASIRSWKPTPAKPTPAKPNPYRVGPQAQATALKSDSKNDERGTAASVGFNNAAIQHEPVNVRAVIQNRKKYWNGSKLNKAGIARRDVINARQAKLRAGKSGKQSFKSPFAGSYANNLIRSVTRKMSGKSDDEIGQEIIRRNPKAGRWDWPSIVTVIRDERGS